MGQPKHMPRNWIELGVEEVQKSYIRGAEDVNRSYGSLAGNQLQGGDGRLMGQYNANNRALNKLKRT
jgi:hypothetical protein